MCHAGKPYLSGNDCVLSGRPTAVSQPLRVEPLDDRLDEQLLATDVREKSVGSRLHVRCVERVRQPRQQERALVLESLGRQRNGLTAPVDVAALFAGVAPQQAESGFRRRAFRQHHGVRDDGHLVRVAVAVQKVEVAIEPRDGPRSGYGDAGAQIAGQVADHGERDDDVSRERDVPVPDRVVPAPRRGAVHLAVRQKRGRLVEGALGRLELNEPVDRLGNHARVDVQVILPLVEVCLGQDPGAESCEPHGFGRVVPVGAEIREGAVRVLERQLPLIGNVQMVECLFKRGVEYRGERPEHYGSTCRSMCLFL